MPDTSTPRGSARADVASEAAFLQRMTALRRDSERRHTMVGILVGAVVLIGALVTLALVADNTTVLVVMTIVAVIGGSALVDFIFRLGLSYAETGSQRQQERRFLTIGFVVAPLFLGFAYLLVSLEPDSTTTRLGLAFLSFVAAISLVRIARHDALDNSASSLYLAPMVQVLLWLSGAVGLGLCAYLLWPLISS